MAERALLQAGVARASSSTGGRCAGGCGCSDPVVEAADGRLWGRHHLLRCHRNASCVRRKHRDSRWGIAGRQGQPCLRPPLALGAVGSTGTTAANAIARETDLVIGIGTRYSDFTTASRTAFQNPDVRFVNINVTAFDAAKHAGLMVVADARAALEALGAELQGWSVDPDYRSRASKLSQEWDAVVEHAYNLGHQPVPAQSEIIGAVNEVSDPTDVVICAAGSMPGDLHKLWRTRDRKGYHVEYGYSCMGYEIAGGIGARLACPDRDVFVMVGDGSF